MPEPYASIVQVQGWSEDGRPRIGIVVPMVVKVRIEIVGGAARGKGGEIVRIAIDKGFNWTTTASATAGDWNDSVGPDFGRHRSEAAQKSG